MLFWCGFAGILFLVAILQFYKTRWFVVFRNFRVISMWFAVFLCYSVWYLYVIQCSFVVFLPPLCPPPLPSSNGNNDMKMSWNCDKKRTIPNTIAKYWQLHGLDLLNMQNDCFWNSDGELCIPPPPTVRELDWSLQAVGGDPGIFQIYKGAGWGGSKLQNITTVSNHYFHPFELAVTFFCFV